MAKLGCILAHLILAGLVLIRTSDLATHVTFTVNIVCIVLCIEHCESDNEIALILSIYHRLDMNQRYLLVNDNPVLILD